MRKAKTSNPTSRSVRYTTRQSGRVGSSGDWRWIRHSRFVQEYRYPLFDLSVVSGRATADLVTTIDAPDKLSVAERGDDLNIAVAVNAAGVCFHARFFPLSPDGRGN
jgi:hypothetical protein